MIDTTLVDKNDDKLLDLPTHPFWEFSLTVYAENVVKLACLALQEQRGMNINIILFACWLAKTGRGRLHKSDYIHIATSLDHWHIGITQNLRQMRRTVSKTPALKPLKQTILTDELAAEHIEQLILINNFSRLATLKRAGLQKATDAVASLTTYAKFLEISLIEQDTQAIQQILHCVFPQVNDSDLDQLCND